MVIQQAIAVLKGVERINCSHYKFGGEEDAF